MSSGKLIFMRIVKTLEKYYKFVLALPFPQLQKGFRGLQKLCLNLCSLKPSLTYDRGFTLFGLWDMNVLLGDDLINKKIFLLEF